MTQLEPGLQREDIEIASTTPQYLNRYSSPDPDTAPSQGQSYRARNNICQQPWPKTGDDPNRNLQRCQTARGSRSTRQLQDKDWPNTTGTSRSDGLLVEKALPPKAPLKTRWRTPKGRCRRTPALRTWPDGPCLESWRHSIKRVLKEGVHHSLQMPERVAFFREVAKRGIPIHFRVSSSPD